jgi:hypothetical protein
VVIISVEKSVTRGFQAAADVVNAELLVIESDHPVVPTSVLWGVMEVHVQNAHLSAKLVVTVELKLFL